MFKIGGIFACVSTAYLGALYTFCWMFRPTRRLVYHFPSLTAKLEKLHSNPKYIKYREKKGEPKDHRWVAFGETLVLKTFLSPIMLPTKVVVALEIYFRMYNGRKTEHDLPN